MRENFQNISIQLAGKPRTQEPTAGADNRTKPRDVPWYLNCFSPAILQVGRSGSSMKSEDYRNSASHCPLRAVEIPVSARIREGG